MVGNGTEKYDHLSDGKEHAVGSCLGSFRNKQEQDTIIAIRYERKQLSVSNAVYLLLSNH